MALSIYSTSISMLLLVATICCLCSAATSATAGEKLPLPLESYNYQYLNRQSRQMLVLPPPAATFYNYYNPYSMMPAVYPYQASVFPIYQGESVFAQAEENQVERGARDTINVLPADTECAFATIETAGIVPCMKTSAARHGSITIKLPKAKQTAVVGIVRGSSERITLRCSEMTGVAAFTKIGKIGAPSDTPRTETGVLQLVVTSTADNGVMKCTW